MIQCFPTCPYYQEGAGRGGEEKRKKGNKSVAATGKKVGSGPFKTRIRKPG